MIKIIKIHTIHDKDEWDTNMTWYSLLRYAQYMTRHRLVRYTKYKIQIRDMHTMPDTDCQNIHNIWYK